MKTSLSILTVLLASATFALAQSGDPAAGAAPAAGEHGGGHGGHHGGAGGAGGQQQDPEARFKKLDTNSDGFLSLDELKASPMGQKDAARAEKMFKKLDADNDGKVSLEEFKAGHGKHQGGEAKE